MDESGISLDHQSPRVVTKRSHKKVRYATSGNKSQITIVGCINAIGQALPPFVIFDAKNLNLEWAEGEVPGTTNGYSSHYNLEAVNFARKNEIILFTLVPHTTHKMQPLDTAVFGPLKTSWQDVWDGYNKVQV